MKHSNNIPLKHSNNIPLYAGLSLVRHYNIPYVLVDRIDTSRQYLWDGSKLTIDYTNSGVDLVHEVGHWLVASTNRKHLPEYGLGPSFRARPATPTISRSNAEMEEAEVCVWEIGIAYLWGYDWVSLAKDLGVGEYPKIWSEFVLDFDIQYPISLLRAKNLFVENIPANIPSVWDTKLTPEMEMWLKYP